MRRFSTRKRPVRNAPSGPWSLLRGELLSRFEALGAVRPRARARRARRRLRISRSDPRKQRRPGRARAHARSRQRAVAAPGAAPRGERPWRTIDPCWLCVWAEGHSVPSLRGHVFRHHGRAVWNSRPTKKDRLALALKLRAPKPKKAGPQRSAQPPGPFLPTPNPPPRSAETPAMDRRPGVTGGGRGPSRGSAPVAACTRCDFEARNMAELTSHVAEAHARPGDRESAPDNIELA